MVSVLVIVSVTDTFCYILMLMPDLNFCYDHQLVFILIYTIKLIKNFEGNYLNLLFLLLAEAAFASKHRAVARVVNI